MDEFFMNEDYKYRRFCSFITYIYDFVVKLEYQLK